MLTPWFRVHLAGDPGLTRPWVYSTNLVFEMQELGVSFSRETYSTRRAWLAALYVPALKDGAFRAIWVKELLKQLTSWHLDLLTYKNGKQIPTGLHFIWCRSAERGKHPGQVLIVARSDLDIGCVGLSSLALKSFSRMVQLGFRGCLVFPCIRLITAHPPCLSAR